MPNITLGEDDKLPIGKYGRMRKEYLSERRPVIYACVSIYVHQFSISILIITAPSVIIQMVFLCFALFLQIHIQKKSWREPLCRT